MKKIIMLIISIIIITGVSYNVAYASTQSDANIAYGIINTLDLNTYPNYVIVDNFDTGLVYVVISNNPFQQYGTNRILGIGTFKTYKLVNGLLQYIATYNPSSYSDAVKYNTVYYNNHDIVVYNNTSVIAFSTNIPEEKINIIAPGAAMTTGLNKQVPYSFNVQYIDYNGLMHIGIKLDSILSNGDIVGKDITYNAAVKDYTGTMSMNIGSGSYIFYIDLTYNDGTENKTVHSETTFTATNTGNIVNGQDVATNNAEYNKMISFFKPASGEIIPYGDATNYGIKIDTTYTNTLTGELLEQYLPPIPEYTGDPTTDSELDRARDQIAIILNGYYDPNTKMTFDQLTMATKLNGSKPFEFPWVNNSGIIKEGLNSLVVISVLVNDEKTSFYNYYYQGMWVHAYAGVEFYIENKPDGYNDGTIPTDPGNELPLRENYPEGIVGDVQFGFDTVLYYITFPFKLIGDALYSLGSLIGTAVSSVNNIITPIGTFLSFIPVEVQTMIKLSLISVVLISILKLIRGK